MAINTPPTGMNIDKLANISARIAMAFIWIDNCPELILGQEQTS